MVSAVILTKNEENNIKRCLDSLSFCEEIIIVDDESDDDTVKNAQRSNVTIYKRHLNNDFAMARNFGMEKAKGDWIMFIDADEEVSRELGKEIKEVITQQKNNTVAYYIRRRDFWWNKELKHGEVAEVRNRGLIRFVRKDYGTWIRPIHEEFKTSGKVGSLKNFLNHYPHPTVTAFLKEINFYSTLRAKELYDQKAQISVNKVISYPLAKFILNYFVRLGFLDGAGGFAYAFLMSFHSFLVRAKLHQYIHYPKTHTHSHV